MGRPTNCITVTEAKALQKNWNTTRAIDIAKAMGSEDVCSVTFNIDQLQEFIDYVKTESTKQGISSPGIRVYFAAYSNKKSTKATVFLNATESDDGNAANNYGIDPLNLGNDKWPPKAYQILEYFYKYLLNIIPIFSLEVISFIIGIYYLKKKPIKNRNERLFVYFLGFTVAIELVAFMHQQLIFLILNTLVLQKGNVMKITHGYIIFI